MKDRQFFDIYRSQIYHLSSCLVRLELSLFYHLPYLPVIGFHAIGGVDHAAGFLGEFEDGCQLLLVVLHGVNSSTISIS
jgi:hypothetical protein